MAAMGVEAPILDMSRMIYRNTDLSWCRQISPIDVFILMVACIGTLRWIIRSYFAGKRTPNDFLYEVPQARQELGVPIDGHVQSRNVAQRMVESVRFGIVFMFAACSDQKL